jgi:hypothetical protein
MATEGVGSGFLQALGQAQSSIPQTASITVNKDNVLQAIKIIHDALGTQTDRITQDLRGLRVIAPGGDPVSVPAAVQWNQKLLTDDDSFRNRVWQYLASLQKLVENLSTSAKQYGYTDEEIATALGKATSG